MSEINKTECPEFDDFEYEKVLEWAKTNGHARVEWSDVFVNGKGERFVHPEQAHWTLLWDKGFIGFDSIRKKEDEAKARKASAMFIYLYCKGVSAMYADRLSETYVQHVHVEKCE